MGFFEGNDPDKDSFKYLGKGFPFDLSDLPKDVARYLSDHREEFVTMSQILWKAAEKSPKYGTAIGLLHDIVRTGAEKGFWEKLFG